MNNFKKLCAIFIILASNTTLGSSSHPDVWITIFVHGIMSIKPHVSFGNFLRFMTDDIHNTVYSKTVELMRNDPIFYQNQAMQDIGLKLLDPKDLKMGNASNVLAMVFEKIENIVDPTPHKNLFYTYGWSGLLSPSQRYGDALSFYTVLEKEITRLRSQNINPHIRIIGYSHGGNVCLNLARIAQEKHGRTRPWYIDELILLGMPVQSETDYLINDPLFKKIYHIYSRGDRIQKLDFFSFNRFFSRRLFKKRKDFALPEKLIQIQLRCTRNTVLGNYEETPQRAYQFSSKSIVGGKSRFLRDASPGHTELWFFSWTPANYRCTFPLYPLPIVAIIPIILQAANYFEEKSLFEKPTLIDIRPEHEIVLIKNQKSQQVLTVMPFLSRTSFKELGDAALMFAPENYTTELYTEHIRKAHDQAKEEHVKEWRTHNHKKPKKCKLTAAPAKAQ